jgi:hypothetical protein
MPTRVSIYHDPSVVPLDPRTRKPISMEEYLYGEATWDEHRQAWVPENGQRDAVASKLGAGWTFDEYYHAFFASKPADAAALEAPAVEMLENAGLDQEPDVRSSPSERADIDVVQAALYWEKAENTDLVMKFSGAFGMMHGLRGRILELVEELLRG